MKVIAAPKKLGRGKKKGQELRFGWASWNKSPYQGEKSVKFIYRGKDGKPSRRSPEIPLDVAFEMVLYLHEIGEIELSSPEVEHLTRLAESLRKKYVESKSRSKRRASG